MTNPLAELELIDLAHKWAIWEVNNDKELVARLMEIKQ